jgi:hypothetical protein
MVNARFPALIRYGFEMVDTAFAARPSPKPASIENLRRIKSFEFFENFRRFNLNANTCDLWTAVSDNGETTAAVAITIATGSLRRPECEMFFLLRLVFWVGLVLVLLPRDKTPGTDKSPQLGASEAVSAATAAVSDMSQFCKRQPAACEVGGQAATVIGERAQAGARKLYRIITDKRSPDHTGSIGGMENAEATLAEAAPHDTLMPDDMQVEWRGNPPPSP